MKLKKLFQWLGKMLAEAIANYIFQIFVGVFDVTILSFFWHRVCNTAKDLWRLSPSQWSTQLVLVVLDIVLMSLTLFFLLGVYLYKKRIPAKIFFTPRNTESNDKELSILNTIANACSKFDRTLYRNKLSPEDIIIKLKKEKPFLHRKTIELYTGFRFHLQLIYEKIDIHNNSPLATISFERNYVGYADISNYPEIKSADIHSLIDVWGELEDIVPPTIYLIIHKMEVNKTGRYEY